MANIKYSNPIYFWLIENLLTEQEIAKERKDLNSYAYTLLCPSPDTKTAFKEKVELLSHLVEENKYNIRDVVALAVLLKISTNNKISLKNDLRTFIVDALDGLESKTIPLKYKTVVYYLLRDIADVNNDGLKNFLLQRRSELLKTSNKSDLLEIEFALGSEYLSKDIWLQYDSEDSSLEKKAKYGAILYTLGEKDRLSQSVSALEKSAWEQISTTSLPTISLLVYEAEKLISTNLSASELMDVLNVLKKKKEWAKLITNVEKEGITVNLKLLNRVTGLTVEDVSWTIQLLHLLDRSEVYQVTEEESHELWEYSRLKSNESLYMPKRALLMYVISVTIVILVTYFYFDSYGIPAINGYFTKPDGVLDVKVFSVETVRDFIAPPVYLLVLYLWLKNSWKNLVTNKNFGVKYALKSIPLLEKII